MTLNRHLALLAVVALFSPLVQSNASNPERCLLTALAEAEEWATVRDVRARCQQHEDKRGEDAIQDSAGGVLEERLQAEERILDRPFALTAHRPNYFLPATYNVRPNTETFRLIDAEEPIDSAEAQFQISFKFPIVREIMGTRNDVFFGFTTRAWWQVYNEALSSPFRETDYEPEIFLRHYGGPSWGKVRIAGWDLGLTHQSNGRSEPLSRSWNRVNANVGLEFGNIAAFVRAWYRLPEDAEDDDNPDLYKYLGYGDIRLAYRHRDQVFSTMFRPGSQGGAFEFTWSKPIWQNLRVTVNYFEGYGESLIDYNHRTRRIGVGIALNDYLGASEEVVSLEN